MDLCCLAGPLAALQGKGSRRQEVAEGAGSSLMEPMEPLGLQVLGVLAHPVSWFSRGLGSVRVHLSQLWLL